MNNPKFFKSKLHESRTNICKTLVRLEIADHLGVVKYNTFHVMGQLFVQAFGGELQI